MQKCTFSYPTYLLRSAFRGFCIILSFSSWFLRSWSSHYLRRCNELHFTVDPGCKSHPG
uniref:Uncharacterized protein n=1 Tax=Bionectria ochroleuca TaxID=29856 RepID=A0A0B7K2W7_BIOOC